MKIAKQHSNSKYSNFSAEDITSDYGFLLRLVNIFTIDTDEYYSMCYKVNGCQESRLFSKPCISFYAVCAKSSYVGLYTLQTWLV